VQRGFLAGGYPGKGRADWSREKKLTGVNCKKEMCKDGIVPREDSRQRGRGLEREPKRRTTEVKP